MDASRKVTDKSKSHSDVARALLISDQNYFKAAAINNTLSSGVFSMVPGFESMPAAFVLHSVDEKEIGRPDVWIEDRERAFKRNKAEMIRVYLQKDNSPLSKFLEETGYQKTIEIGFAMKLEGVSTEEPDERMIAVESNDFLEHEIELSKDAGTGPDGHDMGSGDYARLQLCKIQAGYMLPFFCLEEGRILGSVKMAIEGNLCRLKNILVNPRARRQGVATAMIKWMFRKAADLDMEYIGAYALEKGGAERLYANLGMKEVTRQYEWTKPLGEPSKKAGAGIFGGGK